ncbi:MAG TPA: amidohydrolase family protein [Blastocatellia bacterium]|nr:amidohydrolase family protein [Blastocatellia bacterium]
MRNLIFALLPLLALIVASPFILEEVGGANPRPPAQLRSDLKPAARELMSRAFEGIDSTKLVDYHTHVAGIGAGGTGNFVHPDMRSWLHPVKRLTFSVYLSASGINNIENADREALLRLVDLIHYDESDGKHVLLPFDKNYDADGTVNLEKTQFYVPNEYVFAAAEEFPDKFIPGISVHPYRPDAIEELERWAARKARVVKWLPNAMGIDPSDPRCDPFYEKMRELDLILLAHAGREEAVDAEEDQRLGNPLLLRRALDHGVKVIIAHCAGLGLGEDLDSPGREMVPNFDLFMRLMDDKKYEGLLFADISAVTQHNRLGPALATLIERGDLHHRLVNGSDYPLPAINIVIRTKSLVEAGYITEAEREQLNEIYSFNPLLFDFVLKRTIRAPGTDKRFAPSIFMANRSLAPLRNHAVAGSTQSASEKWQLTRPRRSLPGSVGAGCL